MGNTFTLVTGAWTLRFEPSGDNLKATVESIVASSSSTILAASDVTSLATYLARAVSILNGDANANDLIHALKSYDRMRLTAEEAELRELAAREIYLLVHEVQTAHALLREMRRYILEDSLYFEPPQNLIPRVNDILDDETSTSRKRPAA